MPSPINNSKPKNGIQIKDDRLYEGGSLENFNISTLSYLFLSMGSLKTKEYFNINNEYKSFEIFVNVKQKGLDTGIVKDIGKVHIYPTNYCTPFENSEAYIYFNFHSVDNMIDYLKKNELTFDLNFYQDGTNVNLLSNEKINDFVKPISDVEKKYNISNFEGGFKTCLTMKLEWCIVHSNKYKREISEVRNDNFKSFVISNKIKYKSALRLPNKLYLIYEDTLFSDPLNSFGDEFQKTKSNICTLKDLSNQHKLRRNTLTKDYAKFGGWKIRLTNISLKEEGFIHIYDKFTKYHGFKSFKVFLQYCIKDKDGGNLTPYRSSCSILTLRRIRNSMNAGDISFSELYFSNLNIYSRIPEIFHENISEKYFFIKCTISNTQNNGTKNDINNDDVLFVGTLNLCEFIEKKVIVNLYKNLLSTILIGYINIELSDIDNKIYIPKNSLYCVPVIHKSDGSEQRINVDHVLDELSLLFLYIYLHVEMRSKIEDKIPKDILEELYIKITKLSKCKCLNVHGISICVKAFIPSDHYFFGYINEFVERINSDTLMIDINEFLNRLLFPHLILLKKIYKYIFSENDYLGRNQFMQKCSSLGVRESFAVTWFEMMKRNSDESISVQSYIYCVRNYKVRNIFK
ncbi:hypothetical protein FG386_002664 [Cryptosporidium ryanae]|uniref:uncharacterized protein n=1 Tax=Cryptosporidium ryanae TaxID=515981 RepID=UPI00351A152B|nr:hypothetical protein FG386_002664 [Cryptosporidium ryanae]